jgi:hypothetical protein
MFDGPRGQWIIVPFDEYAPSEVLLEIPDRDEVASFLRQSADDPAVMAHLRGLLDDLCPVFLLGDDEVIETVAWRVAVRQLILLRKRRHYHSGHGGGGKDPHNGPSPHRDDPGPVDPVNPPPSKPKRSWFAVTVVAKEGGSQKVVDGLSMMCQLPDLGQASGTLTKGSPRVRFDDLNPGGTGSVISTSHSAVWEVDEDIE